MPKGVARAVVVSVETGWLYINHCEQLEAMQQHGGNRPIEKAQICL